MVGWLTGNYTDVGDKSPIALKMPCSGVLSANLFQQQSLEWDSEALQAAIVVPEMPMRVFASYSRIQQPGARQSL